MQISLRLVKLHIDLQGMNWLRGCCGHTAAYSASQAFEAALPAQGLGSLQPTSRRTTQNNYRAEESLGSRQVEHLKPKYL